MESMFAESGKQTNTEEGDAGEADAADTIGRTSSGGEPLSEEELRERELLDGPPPGWRAGIVALDAAGAKAEIRGIPSGYERLAGEGAPESHIVVGQD